MPTETAAATTPGHGCSAMSILGRIRGTRRERTSAIRTPPGMLSIFGIRPALCQWSRSRPGWRSLSEGLGLAAASNELSAPPAATGLTPRGSGNPERTSAIRTPQAGIIQISGPDLPSASGVGA